MPTDSDRIAALESRLAAAEARIAALEARGYSGPTISPAQPLEPFGSHPPPWRPHYPPPPGWPWHEVACGTGRIDAPTDASHHVF